MAPRPASSATASSSTSSSSPRWRARGAPLRLAAEALRAAHHKTLDEFDASFQPELDPKRLAELRSLRFIQNKVSSLILGPPDPVSHCTSAVTR
ncbi:MAG: ATP-binding protein [Solirubrobacterales bacterium]|nr:ATP-binding protein [Solirubrobacterales bacterium]